jgi:3,4-dihydroxy 2-butanone 4-phosphate synthase|tara:strand:- start:2567 stop:3229 length:663 start_codon:yes stop_codon:yes gene_type:complete
MNSMLKLPALDLLGGDIVLDRVEDAIIAIAHGEMVIVVDDADRENEGDLIMAADAVTAADINFMATEGRGLICVSLSAERLQQLDLPQMVPNNTEYLSTGFTVTCDLRDGTTTGISVSDRARTIRALADEGRIPADFSRPGHVFPLRAHPEGVLGRPGHTEAALDLARLAGRFPGGVLCEIALPNGEMARLPDLVAFARIHMLKLISIEDLIAWREANDW